jgi:hypothetical protein
MAKSKHEKKVHETAREYERNGFEVEADISGYKRPATINGKRPDVVARKGNEKKIVEVETDQSKNDNRAKEQQKAFRAAANRSKGTTYKRRIARQ